MLKVGQVEMKGAGRSIRGIADDLGVARNTVRRYLKSQRPCGRSSGAGGLQPFDKLRRTHTLNTYIVGCWKAGKLRSVAPGAQDPGL